MNLNWHKIRTKPFRIMLGLLGCALFIVLLGAASDYQHNMSLKGLQVHLVNGSRKSVLKKNYLDNWILKNSKLQMKGKQNSQVDLKQIEHQAEQNPWVANAEVYIDNNHEVQLDIRERKPTARIFSAKGNSFFVDKTLSEMPVIRGNSFGVPVFTNVAYSNNDSVNNALNTKIAYLAQLIEKDPFWNAQIQQIIVKPNQTFILIPFLGQNQRILFGDTTRAVQKLANLYAFYQHVSKKIGWDNYRELDLRYKGQIIARPASGIIIPKPKNPLGDKTIAKNK